MNAPKPAEKYDVTKYERPSVTVDVVIFTILDEQLKVLLIKRKAWPFAGMWAIPGGFVNIESPSALYSISLSWFPRTK